MQCSKVLVCKINALKLIKSATEDSFRPLTPYAFTCGIKPLRRCVAFFWRNVEVQLPYPGCA